MKSGKASSADLADMEDCYLNPSFTKPSPKVLSYPCTKCGRSCRTKAALTKHMTAHRPVAYECSTCGKRFKRQSSLISHAKTHSRLAAPQDKAVTRGEEVLELQKLMMAQQLQQQQQHEELKLQLQQVGSSATGRQEPGGVLDESAAKIALQLQQPLFNILGHIHGGAISTSGKASSVATASEAQIEYDNIIQTYKRGDDLHKLRWQDFISSNQSELQEILQATTSLAHKRALKRLFSDH